MSQSQLMLSELLIIFEKYLPVLIVTAVIALLLWLANLLIIKRKGELGTEEKLPRQLLMLLLTAAGILIIILMFPMSDTTRGQVLGLLGIVLTGVIAFSSTTFVANAMAGLMLRIMKTFRPGDFIHIGDKFGRVSDRGLFHTEIQTEDRDLMTFPNMYLVTNPVTVIHSSGTIVSANLSLGYDVPRTVVEDLLKKAAEKTSLTDPFVLVTELGDFSVTYRIAGFLPEVKHILTIRSNLQKHVMDELHVNGIEIVSPTVMNQRPITEGKKIIPTGYQGKPKAGKVSTEELPEKIMFDKAEVAAEVENLRKEYVFLETKLKELRDLSKSTTDEERSKIDKEIIEVESKIERLAKIIKSQDKTGSE